MKLKDVNKLYESMKPKTLAAMTFESLIRSDRKTANAITDSVPRYTYEAVDIEYRDAIDHFFNIASIWTVEYWKCYAKLLASLLKRSISEGIEEKEKAHDLIDFWKERIDALSILTDALNEEFGLDRMAILNYAGISKVGSDNKNVDILSEDARLYYSNHLEVFKSLVHGTETSPDVDAYFAVEPRNDSVTH